MDTPLKLNQANLPALAGRVAVPTYARERLALAIVHIGVGGFHRAHQAVYLDDLAQGGITHDWGERGIGLLPGDQQMADALGPQDCLYTVVRRGAEADTARVIGSLREYIFAPADPQRALVALADPATRIVTLTITEGGYNIDNQTGAFDVSHPSVQADARAPAAPTTVFGYLVEALDRRRRAGHPPFTVLSCDNLPGNGHVARTAVTSFARLRDAALAAWIEANVAFPNSMVDRITPQTTDGDRAMVAEAFGVADAWPVMTEPFTQWVIEDTFCHGRPPLEAVGAQFVADVHPYEIMKLRLLNASHQAMAYLGYLCGYRTIHEVMGDADFQAFIRRMMDEEVTPLLPPVPGIDLAAYKATLLERFANPKIRDQVLRICTDSSDRMPKFLLPSLAQAVAANRPHRFLTLAVAGWFRYLRGTDEAGQPIPLADPLADELRRRANEGGADPRPLLALRPIFGDLADAEGFVAALGAALRELDAHGAKATLQAALARPGA